MPGPPGMGINAGGDNGMHPAVEHALRVCTRFFPHQAPRARKRLTVLLKDVLEAPDRNRAWGFSGLAKGFPVEFMFNSSQKGIRYTVDAAGPGRHPGNVLQHSIRLLDKLGAHPVPEDFCTFFRDIQRAGTLKYGAWIGGRHYTSADEFKLYVEVPGGADDHAIERLNSVSPFNIEFHRKPISKYCRIKLDLIGYTPAGRQLEYYFSVKGLAAWEIGAILYPAGFETHRDSLMDLLQKAYGRPVYKEFPSSEMGFSYSFSLETGASVFSLYTFASSMFGGDARIRGEILSLARKEGWNMDFYEHMTRPLADARGPKCTHGMVGFAVTEKAPPMIYIGLRPPVEGVETQL